MQDTNQTHLKEATTVSNLADSSLLLAVLKCLKRQVWETTQGLSFVVQREVKEVLCRGSALSKSTYFPNRGTNSCLNLFWAINLVMTSLFAHGIFKSFLRLFHHACGFLFNFSKVTENANNDKTFDFFPHLQWYCYRVWKFTITKLKYHRLLCYTTDINL